MGKSKRKLSLVGIIAIAAGAAVLLAAAASVIIIPMRVNAQNEAEYAEAAACEEAGDYTVAYELYTDLCDYEDSAERARFCADTVSYTKGGAAFFNEDYAEALAIFTRLGTFSDSADRARTCQNEIDLKTADDYYEAGDYAAAQPVYERLGDYKNAADRALYCSRETAYLDGKELMAAGDYDAATEKLTPLAEIMYKDSAALAEECGHEIKYLEAAALLADGSNYAAYVKFDELAEVDYKDSDDKRLDCTVAYPETGTLYRNDAVSGSNTEIKLVNKSSFRGYYLKVYTEDSTLAATMFAKPGDNSTIKLPAGKYIIKQGYGVHWFGEEASFGEEGRYFYAIEDEDNKSQVICSLRSNYRLTLTIPDAYFFNFSDVNYMEYPEF